MMEVMLDRTFNADDGRGLGQGVLDNVPVTSTVSLASLQNLPCSQ